MSTCVPLSDGFVNGDVSFWFRSSGLPAPGAPLDGDIEADVAIVGAGYTGLWTAYYLKKARPDLRVVVLEKEFAGYGASGRNGGWLVGELAGTPERYARTHGEEAARRFQRVMFDTVDEVVAAAGAEGIEADVVKGGVTTVATNAAQDRRLHASLAHARRWGWTEDDVRLLEPAEREERLRVSGAVNAVWSPHCARIQPAKLVLGLAEAVRRLGAEVYERTPVTEIAPRTARTPYGTVRAEHVIRATEGFTAGLRQYHRAWLPMNSSMIVTEPLGGLWDSIGWEGGELLGDMAHYYMYAQRTADGRIAFGGRGKPYLYGSRVDDRGRTHSWTVEALWKLLTGMFPAVAESKVAHTWSGVLGVPRDWCATVHLDRATGIGWAGGYTGHGVTTANLAGRTLRDLVLGEETELTRLPWVGRRVRSWEVEPLRWLGVHTMYDLYRRADAREKAGLGRTSVLARVADAITGR
ncbi:NAD(P)/FAD-dependent oxidoreductase [Planomonospora venezuelensis]|uniref:Glycine/D-amino acid oxidase-like deaminating enzyme n=1 Tax=Planomonospora venezuelensis TaxID=1999 RepID=A0A841D3B0_PLAVE|nr:FAD-binding oxidoreductase [Planomonospora venezuelensis]MBB5963453.1 glycine/D-amino acid oxidase-like deaminating enzyme [Planomonospora venezuelensis]GIN05500.1 FAD-dependent oxidoreductase [Planomonospora venezuelensis]